MSCPICSKYSPKRYCAAKGEKICAICCGREREVSIECPLDCSYLAAAHRYQAEHRPPVGADQFPYKNVEFPVEFVYRHWPLVAGAATAIVAYYGSNKDLNDRDIYTALERLTESYRTLESGLYYERPPESPIAAGLYGEIRRLLQEFCGAEAAHRGIGAVKSSDIFKLLVFLLRMQTVESSDRPRSRAFLAFLRARFAVGSEVGLTGLVPAKSDAPRIIIP